MQHVTTALLFTEAEPLVVADQDDVVYLSRSLLRSSPKENPPPMVPSRFGG